jgi:GT2 family glycosyltransferase
MKVLLAITTANQLHYTKLMINSFPKTHLNSISLCVFDDASTDGTVEWCKENNIEVVTKHEPMGLTHSWNLAYKKFKTEKFDHLILSNNDVIIPDEALDELLSINKKNTIVGPLSTKIGVGHQPLQDLRNYYSFDLDEYDYLNTNKIQQEINKTSNTEKEKIVSYINGFIFFLNKDILMFELSDGNLFDSKNINVGNESELCERVNKKYPIAIALKSYIFHFKGVSFKDINFDNQTIDHNIYRNLNWKEAQELNKNPFKKLIFKIKRRLK